MEKLADGLDAAAGALATVERSLPALSVPAGVFGAAGGGLPGSVGRHLFAHWSAVLAARSREAVQATARVNELARALRSADGSYADSDAAARRRLERTLSHPPDAPGAASPEREP